MGSDALIPANSPSFEYVYVANQRCDCGGYFAAARQELRTLPSGPCDRITARCETCGAEKVFEFDIGSFFGEFERYGRFHQTDDRFREAMEHVRAGEMSKAEVALREVIDPEEGEPAFAWGYYHLGMVLVAQGRAEEALGYLERAAAIQPLEPDIIREMARVCQTVGREGEAKDWLDRYAELHSAFGEADQAGG